MLGTHVSISGELAKSFSEAQQLDCDVMQIFTKEPRQNSWIVKELSDSGINEFKGGWQKRRKTY